MAVNCRDCGETLLEALGEETIRTIHGEVLVFRRTTDYLLCPSCFSLYSVARMRESRGVKAMSEEQAELSSELTDLASDLKGVEEI